MQTRCSVDRFGFAPVERRAVVAGLGGSELTRYHRIAWNGGKVEALFVDLFLEAH